MAAAQYFRSAMLPVSFDDFAAPGYAAVHALALNFAASSTADAGARAFAGGSDKTAGGDLRYEPAE